VWSGVMNERIKQLAEQATTYIEPTATSGEGWIFDKEKFAELIIKECADIATINQYQSYTPGHYVLKHFGVEK
jgi:hypothetical protein